jgi:hypothetical protein
MDSALRAAIEEHPDVDISTHGRKSGSARRIEIRLWHADGRIFLSGCRASATGKRICAPTLS